jgi:hypothetical protein
MKVVCYMMILICLSAVLGSADNMVVTRSPHIKEKASTASGISLSASEWQELRKAREVALRANPDLVRKASQLSQKIAAFDQKLRLAMLRTDPTIAPKLANFSGDWAQATHTATPMPSAKGQ